MEQQQLVDYLIEAGVLRTPAIIDAFRSIDRKSFVEPTYELEAYDNIPLPIGAGQTISQPYTVAFMLELLQPQPGEVVMDIGYGSGWQTCLLAHIVGSKGHVVALEIVPALCEQGMANIEQYDFVSTGVVETHCQNASPGFAARAPYDKIIAAAAGSYVPEAWQAQLKVGGRIVTPIGSSVMVLTKVDKETWERTDYPGFAFVPFVGGTTE